MKKYLISGGGTGGHIFPAVSIANELGCDAFVTGEASYHDAQFAFENGLLLVAAGHFETENPVVDMLTDYLGLNTDAEIIKADPFNVYISI